MLKNIVKKCQPETTLFIDEMEVLVGVLKRVLNFDGLRSMRTGTFILDGRADGEEISEHILRFDLSGGPSKREEGSRVRAEESIDMAISELESREIIGIWSSSSQNHEALVLPTAYGRFFVSCFTWRMGTMRSSPAVLIVTAKTLSLLCPEDAVLRSSYNTLYETAVSGVSLYRELDKYIDDIFKENGLQEIQNWRMWRKYSDDIGPFFES